MRGSILRQETEGAGTRGLQGWGDRTSLRQQRALEAFVRLAASFMTSDAAQSKTILVSHEDMPPWFKAHFKGRIVTGYRPSGKPAKYYLASVLQLSNETINIWSHLVGFFYFAWCLLAIAAGYDEYSFGIFLFDLGSCLCFACSVCYHIFLATNERNYLLLARIDYAGIIVMIVVSCAVIYAVMYSTCFPT